MRRQHHIHRSLTLLAAVGLTIAAGVVWAQDPSAQPQDSGQQPSQPSPAYGVGNTPPVSENPPISAIDQPGLEPHAAPLSYLQLGAHVSESADTNVANVLGSSSGVRSVTRALGSVELQRLWSNYDFALDYVGGAGYFNVAGIGFQQLQQLNVDQRINWKRGQFAVRDSFSYLPEGNFAGDYGSLNTTGQALGGLNSNTFYGGGVFGVLGQVPRILNITLADVTQNLTPKSSVTASGSYAFVHYTGNNPGVDNIPFSGSRQFSAQGGYDRILGPHDQVAVTYGYQGFDFSVPGVSTAGNPVTLPTSFHADVVQLMWGHRISGRMDLLVGAGPQVTWINTQAQICTFLGLQTNLPPQDCTPLGGSLITVPEKGTRLSGAGRASLRYRFRKTSVDLTAQRFITTGSGILPGAYSNIARLSASRPLTRVWSIFADAGYSKNSRVLLGGGTSANTYSEGFAGMGLHRQLGHDFRVYASYQFNYLSFDNSFCTSVGTTTCNRISRRQVGLLGLDWTPRPMRLD